VYLYRNFGFPLGGTFIDLMHVTDPPWVDQNEATPTCGQGFIGTSAYGSIPADVANVIFNNNLLDDLVTNGNVNHFYIEACDDFLFLQNYSIFSTLAYYANGCYGKFTDCASDICQTAFRVTINAGHQSVNITNATAIPGMGGAIATRNAVLFDGTAGNLVIVGLQAHTLVSSDPALPSTASPVGGNALLRCTGSGQSVSMLGCKQKSGTWRSRIDNVSGITIYDTP
jgi:hypothetical protein